MEGQALLGFDTELRLEKKLKCSLLDVMYERADEVWTHEGQGS